MTVNQKDSFTAQRQAIVDSLQALTQERIALIAAVTKEIGIKREEITAQCAALGHVYVPASIFSPHDVRECAFCRVPENRFPYLDLAATAGVAVSD